MEHTEHELLAQFWDDAERERQLAEEWYAKHGIPSIDGAKALVNTQGK